MSDIASLQIKIDSSSSGPAIANLDKLTAASAKASAAAANLEGRSGAVAAAAKRLGISYEEQAAKVAKASAPLVAAAAVATNGAKGLTDALGGNGGAADAFDKAEKSGTNFVNTLTRRFILGFAISQVRNLATNVGGLVDQMARAGDIGKLTGMGSAATQGLISVAGNKGVDNKTMADALMAFNQQIPLAKAGIGGLGELLRGNKITVDDTGSAFFKVADLARNAETATAAGNIVRQAGLPATLEMVRVMRLGGDELRAQIGLSGKLSDAQVDAAAKARDAWYSTWQSMKDGAAQAIGYMILRNQEITKQQNARNLTKDPTNFDLRFKVGSSELESSNSTLQVALEKRAQLLRDGGKPTIDESTRKAIEDNRISRAQQLLGIYGSTTTAQEAMNAMQLQADSLANNHNAISQTRLDLLKKLTAEQTLGITAIRASTDAENVAAATIGMSVGQAQAYAAARNVLNDAIRRGSDDYDQNTDKGRANLDALRQNAAALGAAAQRADEMKFAYESLVRGPLQTMNSALQQGATFWDAFNQAARSALNSISSKLIDMATQKLWQSAFPSTGGGGGGLLSLLGIGGGSTSGGSSGGLSGVASASAGVNHTGYGPGDSFPTRYVHPAHFNDAPRFHSGIGPGERAAVIQNTESVLTAGQMKALAPAGSGSGSVQVNVYNAPAGTSATSTQTKTGGGGTRIDVTLQRHMDDTTATHIASGESQTNQALERRYGLSPRL
jgi:hypothetical protein